MWDLFFRFMIFCLPYCRPTYTTFYNQNLISLFAQLKNTCCRQLSKAASMPHDDQEIQETHLPYKTDDCKKKIHFVFWGKKATVPIWVNFFSISNRNPSQNETAGLKKVCSDQGQIKDFRIKLRLNSENIQISLVVIIKMCQKEINSNCEHPSRATGWRLNRKKINPNWHWRDDGVMHSLFDKQICVNPIGALLPPEIIIRVKMLQRLSGITIITKMFLKGEM
jgi:hypothetical protein